MARLPVLFVTKLNWNITPCSVGSLARLRSHAAALSEKARSTYDSYSLSPAYYALTGRMGGSVIERADTITVTCRHPNVARVQLIFPEIAEDPTYAVGLRVAAETIRRGLVPQFARLTDNHRSMLLDASKSLAQNGWEFFEFEEDVLDWKFPVHVLDTSLVAAREGGQYKRLRQQLKKIDRSRLSVIEYCHRAHSDAVDGLLTIWAQARNHVQYSVDQIVSPVVKLLQMDVQNVEGLRRELLLVDGQVSGLCVWEEPVFFRRPSKSACSCCHTWRARTIGVADSVAV